MRSSTRVRAALALRPRRAEVAREQVVGRALETLHVALRGASVRRDGDEAGLGAFLGGYGRGDERYYEPGLRHASLARVSVAWQLLRYQSVSVASDIVRSITDSREPYGAEVKARSSRIASNTLTQPQPRKCRDMPG